MSIVTDDYVARLEERDGFSHAERYAMCMLNPEWVYTHHRDWFLDNPYTMFSKANQFIFENMPRWVVTNRPLWVVKHYPEWLADNYPDTMISYNCKWMVENRPAWMMVNRKEKMMDYLIVNF